MPKWLQIVLRLLKMECEKHDYCNGCPLWSDNLCRCRVANADIPKYWDIDGEQSEKT